MRARLPVVLLVLAAITAGCTAPVLSPGTTATLPRGLPLPALPGDMTPFTVLVCAGDALHGILADDRPQDCNYRATHDSGPAAEVHLAVNPLNPLNLVGGSKDFTLGEDPGCGKYSVWSGAYTSFDGGRTWKHQLLPGHPGDARKTALSDYSCGSDPVIAFGPDGTVYYVGIYYTEDATGEKPPVPQLGPVWGGASVNSAVAVTRSLDGGDTWEDPVILNSRGRGAIFDKEWMAVDPATGRVYVTYIDIGDGGLYVQRSDDKGLTWTKPMIIEPAGDGAHQFGQVVVDPEGVVHYTYWAEEARGDVSAIYHRASEDKGASWSDRHRVAFFVPVFDLEFTHKYRIVPNPALAVDPVSGALYVSYADRLTPDAAPTEAPPAHTNLNVYVVASTDGGKTWSPPVQVNDDPFGPGSPTNGQWMSAIAVGPDGTVHATWLDYRDDPTGQFAYVYYASSKEGGKSWSRNARVSDIPFDGTGGYHQSGAGTIGDYMGLAASPLAVHPFWADTRDGRNDVFSAIILGGGASAAAASAAN